MCRFNVSQPRLRLRSLSHCDLIHRKKRSVGNFLLLQIFCDTQTVVCILFTRRVDSVHKPTTQTGLAPVLSKGFCNVWVYGLGIFKLLFHDYSDLQEQLSHSLQSSQAPSLQSSHPQGQALQTQSSAQEAQSLQDVSLHSSQPHAQAGGSLPKNLRILSLLLKPTIRPTINKIRKSLLLGFGFFSSDIKIDLSGSQEQGRF